MKNEDKVDWVLIGTLSMGIIAQIGCFIYITFYEPPSTRFAVLGIVNIFLGLFFANISIGHLERVTKNKNTPTESDIKIVMANMKIDLLEEDTGRLHELLSKIPKKELTKYLQGEDHDNNCTKH